MKAIVKVEKEITITHIMITLPVRYQEEDIPNDFPMRYGDVWEATVEIDTGRILSWPDNPRFQKHDGIGRVDVGHAYNSFSLHYIHTITT
jgi:hypothetical protein